MIITRRHVVGGRLLARVGPLTLVVFLASAGSQHDLPDAFPVPSPVQRVTGFDQADSVLMTERCEHQAVRFVARGLWRENSTDAASETLLGSKAHYSHKHGECDVLIEGRLTLATGVDITYSKLWDVFGATPLAAWTGDPRIAVRRGVCQIDVSDDRFVSCRAARFFIDDHMGH